MRMLLLLAFGCAHGAPETPPSGAPGMPPSGAPEMPKGPPPPGFTGRVAPGPDGRMPPGVDEPRGATAAPSNAAESLAPTGHDFTPGSGRQPNAPRETAGIFRMLGATSTDGLVFQRTGRVITDQGNVPDLVADAKGTLYLYYTSTLGTADSEGVAVSISKDGGLTWVHKKVVVDPPVRRGGDPDVVILPDGTFRLWLTGADNPTPGIYYADGTDGIHFTRKGTAFLPPGGAKDSTVYKVGDTWHMLTLDGQDRPKWHATSKDATTFSIAADTTLTRNGKENIGSNAVSIGSSVRMYSFFIPDRTVTSFVTGDGVTWEQEAGVRLSPDSASGLEGPYVKDVAIAKLPNGSWYAVYVTPIP